MSNKTYLANHDPNLCLVWPVFTPDRKVANLNQVPIIGWIIEPDDNLIPPVTFTPIAIDPAVVSAKYAFYNRTTDQWWFDLHPVAEASGEGLDRLKTLFEVADAQEKLEEAGHSDADLTA